MNLIISITLAIVVLALISIPIIFIEKKRKSHTERVKELKPIAANYKNAGYSAPEVKDAIQKYEHDPAIINKVIK